MIDISKKSFSGLFVITLLLLLHVHAQVSIFQVSYLIQKKEKELADLSDEYRKMKFEVSKLHSLSYLDKRKKEMNLKLETPKSVRVIPIRSEPKENERTIEAPPMVRKGFFSFVNLIKEAQAKTSR